MLSRFTLCLFAFVLIASVTSLAQETKRPAESGEGKMQVADTKPQKFDMVFKVREEKFDSSAVKLVLQQMISRLSSAQLVNKRDYEVYVGHDSVQIRMLNNRREVTDWVNLLARQGIMRIHLANDSTYFGSVDTANVPKGMVVVIDPDFKTRHLVSDRFLNGRLIQMTSSIEQMDSPTLTGLVVPTDTNYKSFLFTKGMRFVVVVDGVSFTTGAAQSDTLAINQFPLMMGYTPLLTFIIDRVIRFPYPPLTPVDFLGWLPVEEKKTEKK